MQSDGLPDAVDVRCGNAMFLQQSCRQVGTLHLEAGFALREIAGTQIVQDGCGEQQVTIVCGVFQTPLALSQELREIESPRCG